MEDGRKPVLHLSQLRFLSSLNFSLKKKTITVKDLIMSRVKKEVDIHNTKVEIPYSGLVIPDRVEKLLNGKRKNSDKSKVDFEKQSYIALDGFEN